MLSFPWFLLGSCLVLAWFLLGSCLVLVYGFRVVLFGFRAFPITTTGTNPLEIYTVYLTSIQPISLICDYFDPFP